MRQPSPDLAFWTQCGDGTLFTTYRVESSHASAAVALRVDGPSWGIDRADLFIADVGFFHDVHGGLRHVPSVRATHTGYHVPTRSGRKVAYLNLDPYQDHYESCEVSS